MYRITYLLPYINNRIDGTIPARDKMTFPTFLSEKIFTIPDIENLSPIIYTTTYINYTRFISRDFLTLRAYCYIIDTFRAINHNIFFSFK